MMTVSEAILSRRSIRAFTKTPISTAVIKDLLFKASRAPNGGNLQPWRIYVLNGPKMNEFLEFQKAWDQPEHHEYDIYPEKLKEPYRTSRFQLGEEMYEILDIPREDKDARIQQVMKNFEFFGAPAAIFCFVDKQMGPPQWSDLGMFLQNLMLLAQEIGIDTCAQEAWAMKATSVSQFVGSPGDEMLFCGMAIGYKDPDAPINQLKSQRRSPEEWTKIL